MQPAPSAAEFAFHEPVIALESCVPQALHGCKRFQQRREIARLEREAIGLASHPDAAALSPHESSRPRREKDTP